MRAGFWVKKASGEGETVIRFRIVLFDCEKDNHAYSCNTCSQSTEKGETEREGAKLPLFPPLLPAPLSGVSFPLHCSMSPWRPTWVARPLAGEPLLAIAKQEYPSYIAS